MPYRSISSAGLSWPWVANIRHAGRRGRREHAGARGAAGRSTCPVPRGAVDHVTATGSSSRQSPTVMSPTSAALGGHDGGDPAQRQVTGELADLLGLAELPQPGEPVRVADPGHLGGQRCSAGAVQQPARIRPDHVTADQQQQPGAQAVTRLVRRVLRGEPPARRSRHRAVPSAPDAVQRSCQVAPGWLTSQSSTRFRLAARCRCAAVAVQRERRPPAAVRTPAPGPGRSPASAPGRGRGGNCRITCDAVRRGRAGRRRASSTSDGAGAGGAPVTASSPNRIFSVSGR